MASNRTTVCLTFDFDAISLWIGAMEIRSPSMISRGEFGAFAIERILRFLDHFQVPATFFVPGHTVETYPDHVRAIARAGHEIGHHGYLHENPCALPDRAAEEVVLLRGLEALDTVLNHKPAGYRSPSWDNSPHTVELLVKHGFRYESSLMGTDYLPYFCRSGDEIDLDGPYRFGETVDLVEMPVSWLLDDFPHFEYLRLENRVYPGLSAPSKVEEIWRDEFDFCRREFSDGVFTLTMHPQVIGRGHRMLMLERLVGYFKESDEIQFSTLGAAAEAFRAAQR